VVGALMCRGSRCAAPREQIQAVGRRNRRDSGRSSQGAVDDAA
jgi:hypothetical protein